VNKDKNALSLRKPHVLLATWFGFGIIPHAPGTWGSAAAIPFGLTLYAAGGIPALLAGIVVISLIGYWAAARFDEEMGTKDSKMIVIDEVAGQWIALLPAGLNPLLVVLSFICFRAFDILKPWPVSHFDKNVKGAAGVMGDDILAGTFAAICVYGAAYAGFG